MRKMAMGTLAAMLVAGIAQAGLDRATETEIAQKLEGRTAITKIDIKNIKIKKQVRGDQRAGMFGGENMEQTKDATQVTSEGVTYRDEAHSREVLYAPRGSSVVIEEVDFGKREVEIKVQSPSSRETTVVTLLLETGDRAALDKMLSDTFELR